MSSRRGVLTGGGVLAVLALVTACSGGSGSSVSAGPSAAQLTPQLIAPHLTATLTQDRLDADAHRITATLHNASDRPVQVSQIDLAAPALTPVPPTRWDIAVPAHDELDLWFGYGAPVCPAPAGEPVLVLTLGSVGGGPGGPGASGATARVPLRGDTFLRQLTSDGCAEQAVADAVQIRYGTAWKRTRVDGLPALIGDLELTRVTAKGQVAVTDYQGSPIYQLEPPPPARLPQVALAAGAAHGRLPVAIRVDRCDSHGLTEAKRLFAWRIYVRFGTGPEQRGSIEPPDELRTKVHGLLADCGTRPVDG